jgi:hypothetical protein
VAEAQPEGSASWEKLTSCSILILFRMSVPWKYANVAFIPQRIAPNQLTDSIYWLSATDTHERTGLSGRGLLRASVESSKIFESWWGPGCHSEKLTWRYVQNIDLMLALSESIDINYVLCLYLWNKLSVCVHIHLYVFTRILIWVQTYAFACVRVLKCVYVYRHICT